MKQTLLNWLGRKAAVLAVLIILPATAGAQYFTFTDRGDLYAGFRKTGSFQENYEMVVYLGNVGDFMALTSGQTTNITNYGVEQVTNMCPDNLANLQWSVFSSFGLNSATPLTTSTGVFPVKTCWYTVPRSNPSVRTTPVNRFPVSNEGDLKGQIQSVGNGAAYISEFDLPITNDFNDTLVVQEPVALDPNNNLTAWIGDATTPSLGDFDGNVFTFSVENITPSPFNSAVVSDFYCNVPVNGTSIVDPISGLTTGKADYLGYFTLNTDGTMSFTRGTTTTTPPAPVAGFTTSATNGFAPLSVVFTDTSTGTITNWLWNFGNGASVTNTSNVSPNNIYATGGPFTVTLTVSGPGGSSSTNGLISIAAYPTPKISSLTSSAGFILFSGTNCPAGVQYRILTQTNVAKPLSSWIPVTTNTFLSNGSFSYSNPKTNPAAYFRLVSP